MLIHPLEGPFDAVLCCSLTKWIHFHGGDDAVRRLFARIDDALAPGGLCILEPQPWRSYKRKAGISDDIRRRYQSIQLKSDTDKHNERR